MDLRHAVIVTAAGSSRRFNSSNDSNMKKEFASLGSCSVLSCALRPFLEIPGLAAVVVTYREGELEQTRKALGEVGFEVAFVKGGATRQQSVFNGLKYLYDHNSELNVSIVSIHDGARPYVTKALIEQCIFAAERHGGACPCIRVTDTLVKVSEDGVLSSRIPRDGVCTVQTPQTFRFPDIYLAHKAAVPGKAYTDDTEIFMDHGGKVGFVQGDEANIKITYASDLKEGR